LVVPTAGRREEEEGEESEEERDRASGRADSSLSTHPFWRFFFPFSIVVMAVVDLISIGEIALGNVWIGQWLWVSPSAFSSAFIGTALLVRRKGLGDFDAFLISLTTMISMIWMYEIFYHFGFYVDWEFGKQAAVLANYNEPVVTDVLLTSVGLVGLRYMRAGVWFVLSFGALLVTFVTWVVIGYPQIAFPGTLYPFGPILIHVSDPQAYALPLNAATKFLLAASYVSLFAGGAKGEARA
jgi:hypothetical protein